MAPGVESLIRLQALDSRIAQLEAEIASLPKHIALIEKTLEAHLRRLEADRAAQIANQKERRMLEAESQLQDQKISKLKEQMMEARTNEQYRAFQHEIEYCQQQIRKFEDRILQLMLDSETLEQNVKAAEGRLKKENEQVEREKAEARERTAVDRAQLEQAQTERKGVVSVLNPQLVLAYEKLMKRHSGIAVADATDGRCGACHITLRPQFFQDLRRGEQLMYCESCSRILYYNPPVSFEVELSAQPVIRP